MSSPPTTPGTGRCSPGRPSPRAGRRSTPSTSSRCPTATPAPTSTSRWTRPSTRPLPRTSGGHPRHGEPGPGVPDALARHAAVGPRQLRRHPQPGRRGHLPGRDRRRRRGHRRRPAGSRLRPGRRARAGQRRPPRRRGRSSRVADAVAAAAATAAARAPTSRRGPRRGRLPPARPWPARPSSCRCWRGPGSSTPAVPGWCSWSRPSTGWSSAAWTEDADGLLAAGPALRRRDGWTVAPTAGAADADAPGGLRAGRGDARADLAARGRAGIRGDVPPHGQRRGPGGASCASALDGLGDSLAGRRRPRPVERPRPRRRRRRGRRGGIEAGRPHRIRITHFADTGRRPGRRRARSRRRRRLLGRPGHGRRLMTAAGAHTVGSAPPAAGPRPGQILDAVRAPGTPSVILLPNDGDTVLAAEAASAAAAAEEGITVRVVPARTVVQGMAALAVFDPRVTGSTTNVLAMTSAAVATRHGAVTVAVREALTGAGRVPARATCSGSSTATSSSSGRPDDRGARGSGPAARDRRRARHPGHRRRARPDLVAAVEGPLPPRRTPRSRSSSSTAGRRATRCSSGWSEVLTESTRLTKVIRPNQAAKFAKDRGIETVGDLLGFWPRRYRTTESNLADLEVGRVCRRRRRGEGRRDRADAQQRGATLTAVITDGTHDLDITFFSAYGHERALPVGAQVHLRRHGRRLPGAPGSSTHPEYSCSTRRRRALGERKDLMPVYLGWATSTRGPSPSRPLRPRRAPRTPSTRCRPRSPPGATCRARIEALRGDPHPRLVGGRRAGPAPAALRGGPRAPGGARPATRRGRRGEVTRAAAAGPGGCSRRSTRGCRST